MLSARSRVEAHQYARYRQNLSIGCKDIKIFKFFNMVGAAILYIQICEISLADSVWKAQTHHRAEYRQNRSFYCRDNAIFRIFRMAVAAILDFWNREIFNYWGAEGRDALACQMSSNWSVDVNILRFFKMAAVCQILVMIDTVVFILWTFQYLACLAGKCLFTPPKLRFLANLIL